MSTYLRIPSEPTYVIILDDEDDSEYNVPLWANGVKLNESHCNVCATQVGPWNRVEGDEILIDWIPVYHQYIYPTNAPTSRLGGINRLLCRDCVEKNWFGHHENLHLVAEYMGDAVQIIDMLEKPWRYTDEWWAAFGIEQDEQYDVRDDEKSGAGTALYGNTI